MIRYTWDHCGSWFLLRQWSLNCRLELEFGSPYLAPILVSLSNRHHILQPWPIWKKKKIINYVICTSIFYEFKVYSIVKKCLCLISYGKQSILADMNFISIWSKILTTCSGKTSTFIWYKFTSGDIHSLNPLHQNIWNQIMRTWLFQYHTHILINYGNCFFNWMILLESEPVIKNARNVRTKQLGRIMQEWLTEKLFQQLRPCHCHC